MIDMTGGYSTQLLIAAIGVIGVKGYATDDLLLST